VKFSRIDTFSHLGGSCSKFTHLAVAAAVVSVAAAAHVAVAIDTLLMQ